jgi:cephalosporin-C deacetylase-like acetyl esterase
MDGRKVLDWLQDQPDVDPERIGELGLSLGGIKAALVAAVDHRVKAVVMGLAGGTIADIAVSSHERGLKRYIDRWQQVGVSRERIYQELLAAVQTDPVKLACYLDASRCLLFLAIFDQSVPTKCGNRLRQAIGGPMTIYLPTGHYSAVLFLPYAQLRSLAFLKHHLAKG